MKQFITFFALLLLVVSTSVAQRERNYIYLFDCTTSMLDGATPAGLKNNPSLFKENTLYLRTKQYLRDDIERIDNGETSITIMPFAQDHTVISFCRADFDWKNLEKQLDDMVRTSLRTNIAMPLEAAFGKIDQHKDNYLFIITDGDDNVGGCSKVVATLNRWCSQYTGQHGFYVALDDDAIKCDDLRRAIDNCVNMQLVTGEHPAPFGDFDSHRLTANAHRLPTKRAIGFSAMGTFSATLQCNDPYFDIQLVGGTIANGKATFQIELRKGVDVSLLTGDSYQFDVQVCSQPQELQIIGSALHVVIDLREMPNLNIVSEEVDLGRTRSYSPFLFAKGKEPETLSASLQASFNDTARHLGAQMRMTVSCDQLDLSQYSITWNGHETDGRHFTLDDSCGDAIVGIRLHDGVPSGKYIFTLHGESQLQQLSINDEPRQTYDNTLRLRHIHTWNPLATALFWIGIVILAALVLWFVMLRRICYPAIGIKAYTIQEPYFRSKRLHGARKVVFCNAAKQQSWLSRLFTGAIIYEVHPFWSTPLTLTPGTKRKRVRLSGLSTNYTIDPAGNNLTANNTYTITNLATNEKSTVKLT